MNGAQDMGGEMGFGPIKMDPDEPPFHADWERRIFGINFAMGATGAWNLDMGRYARESLPPAEYLSSSYYEIWATGLEKLVLQSDLVTPDELTAGRSLAPGKAGMPVLNAEEVPTALTASSPREGAAAAPARFAVGDPVVTRNMKPKGPHPFAALCPRQARHRRAGA